VKPQPSATVPAQRVVKTFTDTDGTKVELTQAVQGNGKTAAQIAAEVNAGISAGHQKAAVAPASKFAQKVQKTVSRYAPPLPKNGETMPPITDDDVPF